MSFFGLGLAGSALDAFQVAEDVTSQNIASVQTPGASRQTAVLADAPPIAGSPFYTPHFGPGTRGDGTIVQSIQRIHQDSYDTLFRGASSSQNFFGIQQDQLNATQAQFSEPNGGINDSYGKFQQAIQQLAASPTDVPSRSNVVSSASALTQALSSTAAAVAAQKAQVIGQATSIVTQVNNILDQIAALNGQIRASTAVGDNPNTYKDQRDHLIDQLAQYLPTQTSIQATGSTLVTVAGKALVNDVTAYHLAAPVVGTTTSGATIGAPVLEIAFVNDPTPANPTNPIPVSGAGQLSGYLDLYNNKLTVYGNQLDNFASSLAAEFNRVSQAGYDINGVVGQALFQPIVGGLAIAAGNIKVGITDPSQIPAGTVSTAAGSLVVPLNSANNAVDTSAPIDVNPSIANSPPVAGVNGTLTIGIDGVVVNYAYNTATTDSSIDKFINNFNALQAGVTASFNVSSEKIVFTRDPNNESLALRGTLGSTPTPDFTLSDNGAGGGILNVLGANAINGVNQNNANAFGPASNGLALALQQIFSKNVATPAFQGTVAGQGTLPGPIAGAPVTLTLAPAGGLGYITVGTQLLVDAGTANAETITVTAINKNTQSFTATYTKNHAGANVPIVGSSQTQTLGQYFGGLVTLLGLDSATAITGNSTQTALTNNIDKVRQSIDGINVDEEAQNLVKFQTAYQAAARTINVINQMLELVVTKLGQ